MGSSAATGLAVAAGVLVVATVIGLWWRRWDGRVRVIGPDTGGGEAQRDLIARPELIALGVDPDVSATLLQFSSTSCAPCRVARRVCAALAATRDGVAHVELDAESHLESVRSLGVWRTPTVLVLDSGSRIRYRVTGAPGSVALAEAVDALLPADAAAAR
ncbi:MAG TPA: thioredoxin family protein [Rugosimonospora sp.]